MGIKYSGTKLSFEELATILNGGGWSVVGGKGFANQPELAAELPLKVVEAKPLVKYNTVSIGTFPFHIFDPVIKEIRQILLYEIRVYGTVEKEHARAKSEGGGTKWLPVTAMILRLVNLEAKKLADEVKTQENAEWQRQEGIRRREERALERRKTYNAERRLALVLGSGMKVKFTAEGTLEISAMGSKKKLVIRNNPNGDSSWTTVNGIDIENPISN